MTTLATYLGFIFYFNTLSNTLLEPLQARISCRLRVFHIQGSPDVPFVRLHYNVMILLQCCSASVLCYHFLLAGVRSRNRRVPYGVRLLMRPVDPGQLQDILYQPVMLLACDCPPPHIIFHVQCILAGFKSLDFLNTS